MSTGECRAQALVGAGHAPKAADLAEGPLHHPTAREQRQAALGFRMFHHSTRCFPKYLIATTRGTVTFFSFLTKPRQSCFPNSLSWQPVVQRCPFAIAPFPTHSRGIPVEFPSGSGRIPVEFRKHSSQAKS